MERLLLCLLFVTGCATSGPTYECGSSVAVSAASGDSAVEVLRVVDGDTYDVRVSLGYDVFIKLRIRLYGVDTPETFGRKKGSDEYMAGMRAKQFVLDWVKVHGKSIVICDNHGTGKYGRWLLELCAGETNLGTELVKNGHAKEYFGGKR